jgi:galactokinase
LAESGIEKQTLKVLQNARNFAQKAIEQVKREDPQFNLNLANENDYEKYLPFISDLYKPYWYAAIYNYSITQKAKELLTKTSPTFDKLGILMNSHQKILQECIQNTPSQMIKQMEAAKIGSGGGGCMGALTDNDSKAKVIKAFKDAGSIKAYEVEIKLHL